MNDKHKYATPQQFQKVVLRMMPSWASSLGEGKLIAGVMSQAWSDAMSSLQGATFSNRFFSNENGVLEKYCSACGLNWKQVSEMYEKNCKKRGFV